MNCGQVSCGPFILSLLNMEEDKIGVEVGIISKIPQSSPVNLVLNSALCA